MSECGLDQLINAIDSRVSCAETKRPFVAEAFPIGFIKKYLSWDSADLVLLAIGCTLRCPGGHSKFAWR